MQVSPTLIAAQQAAREAQARFQAIHMPSAQPSFAAALEKAEGFSPLPLKQTAAAAPQAAQSQPQASRPGALLDITV